MQSNHTQHRKSSTTQLYTVTGTCIHVTVPDLCVAIIIIHMNLSCFHDLPTSTMMTFTLIENPELAMRLENEGK